MKTRKIKNAVILVCIIILTACNSVKHNYVVNGVLPKGDADVKFVHMVDYNDGIVIDSVKATNGKFTFKGVVDEPKAVMLASDMHKATLILEKGVITVDMSEPDSPKGSPLTDEFYEYLSKSKDLVKEINEKFMSFDKTLPQTEILLFRDSIIHDFIEKNDEMSLSYLENHSNDILGAMIFYAWMANQSEPSAEKFNRYSKLVGENVMNFGPVKQIANHYSSMNNIDVGAPFIDFTIENGNIDGTPVSLSDYVGKGKYVLVAFWASWCMPCRMEARVISEVYNQYKGDKFEAVSVAVGDRREATLNAIEKDRFTWPQIVDAQDIPINLYKIQGIPHILLFGPDGTIVARDLRGNNLRNKVAEVLKN
jgi:Peroxiredoxin